MKLKDIIAFVDRVKPNAFTNTDKTQWINDFEAMTQMEELLLHPYDIVSYVWESEYSGSITFSDDRTILIPDGFDVRKYGTVTVDNMTTLTGNEGSYQVEQLLSEEKEMVFADHSFAAGTDTGKLIFDGKNAELLLPDAWQKVYIAYLAAQIDLFNGEYDKYDNTMAVFNGYYGDYKVWYTTHWPTVKEMM